ncbi:MAG: hypothetical protein HRU12_03160, partial [Phaeodactylibacter sp.]|nr:hypothetical protein [Phaeodactylibacter sp.]
MSTTTTVTGPIETLEASALEGKYIRFTLLTSGTETGTGDLVAASTKSYLLDASGDFSATLWVNGESGVESVYRIEIPGDLLTYEVIIPTSAGGGTISVEDLIENHQVSGSSPQQSSTLAQAQAYTDTLANNPENNASFNVGNWVSALDVFQLGDDASFNTLDLTQAASASIYSLTLANNTGFRGVGAGSLDFGYYRDGFPVWYATASGLFISDDVRLASGPAVNEIETTITDDDSHIPTSGAVVDYLSGQSAASSGFADYNDTTGSVSITADTWTDVPNNGAGAFTNTSYLPSGVTSLIDTSTGYLDFSDLSLGSEILIRNDLTVVPQTNNALLEARYLLGTGAGEYQLLFWSERLDSGSGIDYQRVVSFPIYMGDTNTQGNPGKLQIRLSSSGTFTNAGSYISM